MGADQQLTARAADLDAADPIAAMRERFDLGGDEVVYLDGNSLGAMPRSVPAAMADVVEHQWREGKIRSWRESGWWDAPERVGDRIGRLIGAGPGQCVVGDSTSVTIFRSLCSALRIATDADPGRTEIVLDSTTFPTDGYVAASVARCSGATVLRASPAEMGNALGARTAVVLCNNVDYRTGRWWDLPAITTQVHSCGAYAMWDLSHSAGAIPIGVDEHDVDFAVGCTYKFLCGGPGSPAYSYVRHNLLERIDQPLPGWCSHADPFGMSDEYQPAPGISRMRSGTPEILSLLALNAALDVFDGVAIGEIRRKNLALTEYFCDCVGQWTPALEPALAPGLPRGSQVSLRHPDAAHIMTRLVSRGVIGDFRPPDILRFGFAAPYLRFADAARAAQELAAVLDDARVG